MRDFKLIGQKMKLKKLDQWNIILEENNAKLKDGSNIWRRERFDWAMITISEVLHLSDEEAMSLVNECKDKGLVILVSTHFERAELYEIQFKKFEMIVSKFKGFGIVVSEKKENK